MKWTEDQYSAVYARPALTVVSAAAGSGKTQVLTSRITERLKNTSERVSINRLLIVTFTKAAASEMRERIGKSLTSAAKSETDSEKKAYLLSQLSLLSSAQICTIDSFCYDIVRQNFYEAGLPADISIGDSGELSLLKIEALEKTVDSFYSALDSLHGVKMNEETKENAHLIESLFPDETERAEILKGFEELTQCYSSDKSDSDFTGFSTAKDFTYMISQLHEKAQSAAFPYKWLDEAAEEYNKNYKETDFFKNTVFYAKEIAKSMAEIDRECAEFSACRGLGYENMLFEESVYLSEAAALDDYDLLRNAFFSDNALGSLPRRKKDSSPDDAKTVQNERQKLKTLQKTLRNLLEMKYDDCENVMHYLCARIKALCAAAKVMDKIYYEKMIGRKIMDFSTCEHLALRIISPDGINLSETGSAIMRRYDEIYIDEMQDSNDLQDTLFSAISSGHMFMVGDVKQSIYGFRNTDPYIFMRKCDESSFDEDSEKRKIFLSKNFRSRKCIIDAVNEVFDKLMRPDTGDIDYIKEHRLEFGASFMGESADEKPCEIAVVSYSGNTYDRVFAEASYIAGKISEIVGNEKVWDKSTGEMRPAVYSDIAILMNAPAPEAAVYEQVFSEKKIPLYYDGGNGFFDTGEVAGILELLKLIDNSECDVPLASSMRSPMFMFNENELAEIRLYSDGTFSDALRAICENGAPGALREKCISFSRTVSRWREESLFVSVDELLRRIYTETGITSAVLAFPDGEKRRANLELLLEKAAEYEKSNYRGLFNFVNYVGKIKKSGGGAVEAKSISEKMNVVRLMSIHKSKGLEFPIVFIGSCSKKYIRDISAGGMLCDMKTGISLNVTDPHLRIKYRSPMQSIISHISAVKSASEDMRLFYVAATRARESLYAVCSFKEGKEFTTHPFDKLSSYDILLADSFTSLLELSAGDAWNRVNERVEIKTDLNEESSLRMLSFKENEDINKRLEFVYPYEKFRLLPNKASVSYLKSSDINLLPEGDGSIHSLGEASVSSVKLRKISYKKEITGAFFGTAHHKMLEHLTFDGRSASEQKEELYKRGILSEDEYHIIDDNKIAVFLKSGIAQRIANAEFIRREAPFVINIGANEIDPLLPETETICVQGIIDCYFKEGKSIVLLDYKTDFYTNPSKISEKYSKQLYYYEKALSLKYPNFTIEKYIYLLHGNEILKL